MDGSFGAVVSINGRQSILEKVHVESNERLMGFPKVLFIDSYDREAERIIDEHKKE